MKAFLVFLVLAAIFGRVELRVVAQRAVGVDVPSNARNVTSPVTRQWCESCSGLLEPLGPPVVYLQ